MKTAALIIAAGKTSRRDGFSPQKKIGTISALQRVIKVFRCACVERVVVVCDRTDDKTEKLAAHMGASFVHSPKDAEMLDGIKTGLEYLKDKCSAALITHVDAPLFSAETVRLLMRAEKPVSIPFCGKKKGHPILMRSECFQPVLSYGGDGGLAGAIKALGIEVDTVDVDDEGVILDTKYEDYERLLAGHSLAELRPEIKIRLAREKAFYGPGTHQLLSLTDETSSLSEACRQMGISGSKGRAIIALIEQQLRKPVFESRAGGKAGGYSVVTRDGKELMRNYRMFRDEAKRCVNELFKKYF